MLRFLIPVLLFLILFVLARYLFAKFVLGIERASRKSNRAVTHGRAFRDPQCGIYVDEQLAVEASAGGRLHHFCSTECRDRYLLEHASGAPPNGSARPPQHS